MEERKNMSRSSHIACTSRTNEKVKNEKKIELAMDKDYINDSSSFHPCNIENTIIQAEKIDFSKKNISILSDEEED